MAKEIHLKNEVNELFKEGLKFLMLGFNPMEFRSIVENMKERNPWTMFINTDFIDNVLLPYAKNWEKVVDEYFTWDQERFVDPVDQCLWLKDVTHEIYWKLMEGVEHDNFNPFFVNLNIKTAKCLDHLGENIEEWATHHKFYGDVLDILEDGDG